MTAHLARSEPIEASDAAENSENAEPTDPIETNDPMDPIDNTEPMDPIDNTELFEPIESNDRCDHNDHSEFSGCISMVLRPRLSPALVVLRAQSLPWSVAPNSRRRRIG